MLGWAWALGASTEGSCCPWTDHGLGLAPSGPPGHSCQMRCYLPAGYGYCLSMRPAWHNIPPSSVPVQRWFCVLGSLLGLRCTDELERGLVFFVWCKKHPRMPGPMICAMEGGVC